MEIPTRINDLAHTLLERIGGTSGTQMVFGPPHEEAGLTVIPVAEVAYRFGLGMGGGSGARPDENAQGSGGGAGAGANVRTHPIGYIEITGDKASFVPAFDLTRIIIAALVTLAIIVLAVTRTRQQT